MKTFISWIDIDCKSYYLDSSKCGLRLFFDAKIDNDDKKLIKSYLAFLRKRYFFPLRCNVYITSNAKYKSKSGGYCNGIFFEGQEENKTYPSIYLPIGFKGLDRNMTMLFNLTKLLTYYYQWFFYQEKTRSHRSLEIEATKMSSYLVSVFLFDGIK